MTGKTHLTAGSAAALTYLALLPQKPDFPIALGIFGAGVLGSLLPDIDHKNSKITHMAKPVGTLVSFLFGHRGLFHAPLFYLALLGLFWKFCPIPALMPIGYSLFIGIGSHLLMDMLTVQGIPLLFPLTKQKIHVIGIRTSGKAEKAVWVLLMIYIVAMIAYTIFPEAISGIPSLIGAKLDNTMI